jgi:hypothetical protein
VSAEHSHTALQILNALHAKKHNIASDYSVLIEYNGTLNPEVISTLESQIEQVLNAQQLVKTQYKKLFFICIETLQNMFIHGACDADQKKHNYFMLTGNAIQFQMHVGNLMETAQIEKTKFRIDEVNAFDNPDKLKAFYLDHLDKNQISEKGGAGLGFITIGMKSANPIKYSFNAINSNLSVFNMEVSVSRS